MTLEQLRIFVAVAEREHMTRAAEALGLVQSGVSAAIAALETQHDVHLFDRVGRRVELTEAGRLFLAEARDVLARAAAAQLTLADLAGLKRGTLSIHASQTIGTYWLPARLAGFRKAYPAIDIRLAIGNTAQVTAGVIAGTAELGFVEGEIDAPTLSNRAVEGDRLAVVIATSEAPARNGKLTQSDILAMDWVLREPGSGTRSEFEAELRRRKIDPAALKIVLELPSNEAVRSAVLAGAGATAISELVVGPGLRYGSLQRLDFDMPQRPFHILRHKERYRSRAADALLDIVAKDTPAKSARRRKPVSALFMRKALLHGPG
jgi:DNA-binding transcriptional LysR family regulator